LLRHEFLALQSTAGVAQEAGAVIGADPNVGSVVFSPLIGGGSDSDRLFHLDLAKHNSRGLHRSGDNGAVEPCDLAARQAQKVFRRQRLRDAGSTMEDYFRSLPHSPGVVFVGNAFANKTMRNARKVGGFASPASVLTSAEFKASTTVPTVFIPESFTSSVAVVGLDRDAASVELRAVSSPMTFYAPGSAGSGELFFSFDLFFYH
jgi:hypothetical protein